MNLVFEKMFKEVAHFLEIDEIAYLKVVEGELIATYKWDTEDLPMDKWITFHKQYRSFVKDSPFLIELVEKKQMAIIEDTNQLPKKPVEFEVLNICSIYLFPIIKNDQVIGILDLAYRNNTYELSNDQIDAISKITQKYSLIMD
jgi:GAF domain-containing protein